MANAQQDSVYKQSIKDAAFLFVDLHGRVVKDADGNEVSQNAEKIIPPASLAKVMTTYQLFQAIKDGKLKWNDKITIGDTDVKAGLQYGGVPFRRREYNANKGVDFITSSEVRFHSYELTVGDAVRAMLIPSANDVAIATGRHLARLDAEKDANTMPLNDTEADQHFVRTMNAQARKLGMHNTDFRDASGLPQAIDSDPKLRKLESNKMHSETTARDMAKLAVAIYRNFPDPSMQLLLSDDSMSSFDKRGSLRKATKLELPGSPSFSPTADALKTGFTNESGFNVISRFRQGGRDVVGVYLGGGRGSWRDAQILIQSRRALGGKNEPLSVIDADSQKDIDSIKSPEPAPSTVIPQSSVPEASPALSLPPAQAPAATTTNTPKPLEGLVPKECANGLKGCSTSSDAGSKSPLPSSMANITPEKSEPVVSR